MRGVGYVRPKTLVLLTSMLRGKLAVRQALLVVQNHENSKKPLVQVDVLVIEDCAYSDAESGMASVNDGANAPSARQSSSLICSKDALE
jgi:hypothetical protein